VVLDGYDCQSDLNFLFENSTPKGGRVPRPRAEGRLWRGESAERLTTKGGVGRSYCYCHRVAPLPLPVARRGAPRTKVAPLPGRYPRRAPVGILPASHSQDRA
jgi:hypothetical protein